MFLGLSEPVFEVVKYGAKKILSTPLDLILMDIRKRYVPARLKEHYCFIDT